MKIDGVFVGDLVNRFIFFFTTRKTCNNDLLKVNIEEAAP